MISRLVSNYLQLTSYKYVNYKFIQSALTADY